MEVKNATMLVIRKKRLRGGGKGKGYIFIQQQKMMH